MVSEKVGDDLMKLDDLTFEVRDINLARLGQIVEADLDVTLADQYNNVGSWTLKVRSDHPLADALRTAGSGIVVSYLGTEIFSGPTTKAEDAATSDDPGGTLTVEGVTDTIALADRLCVPDPSNPNLDDQGEAHDIRTGNVEDLMFAFTDYNAGPSATSNRRTAHLTMGTNGHRGASIRKSVRFPVLGNVLGELAVLINLGFRVIQRGSGLKFETYASTDRTAEVRLDINNDTLAGHRVQIGPPTVTRVLVAGQGDLTDRTFIELTNAEATAAETKWGRRIELFKDQRQTDDPDELENAGKDELEKGGHEMVAVQVVPMEDSALDYGRDWNMGDWVTVVVNGTEIYSQVTGFIMKADKQSIFKFGAQLGDPQQGDTQSTAQSLDARVSNLERNSETPRPTPQLSPSSYNDASLPSTYPVGESILHLNNVDGTAGSWGPHVGRDAWGIITTYHEEGDDTYQTWNKIGVGGGERWIRNGNHAGWGTWNQQQNVMAASSYGMTGEIKIWSTTSAPSGWAICDGSALNRTSAANLFAVIGTSYGAGNGTTTFNVPNLQGRVPVGRDPSDATWDTMGKTAGAKQHTLVANEMPNHRHQIAVDATNGWTASSPPNSATTGATGFVAGTFSDRVGTATTTSTFIQTTGGGAGHNNIQPVIALTYIIKL